MATKLTVTLSAFVIAVASNAGSAFAEDVKSEYRSTPIGTSDAGSLQEKKTESMRSQSSSESIQLRFGGASGLTMGGTSGGAAESNGATGNTMGNRVNLQGGEWRRSRGDGPPEHPRKWGAHPNKGHPRGDR